MAALDTQTINQLILSAFTGQMTWLEASRKYSVDDFIDTFHSTRAVMLRTLSDVTDAQVKYSAPGSPTWMLSETVTHLVYTQNAYHNSLVDAAALEMPHMAEAAKGFGEGSRQNVPSAELRVLLEQATDRIKGVIERTRHAYDPARTAPARNPLFGEADYRTWLLLMLAHEVDHVRQAIVMRRLARAAVTG